MLFRSWRALLAEGVGACDGDAVKLLQQAVDGGVLRWAVAADDGLREKNRHRDTHTHTLVNFGPDLEPEPNAEEDAGLLWSRDTRGAIKSVQFSHHRLKTEEDELKFLFAQFNCFILRVSQIFKQDFQFMCIRAFQSSLARDA